MDLDLIVNSKENWYVSNISLESVRGLVLRATSKAYVITCLSHIPIHYFNEFDVQNVSKTEDWRKFCVTFRHLFYI